MPKSQAGPVKHLVKNGISAADLQAKDRTNDQLRALVREIVERGIVYLHAKDQKEYLLPNEVDLLARYTKLILELPEPGKGGEEPAPGPEMTSEALMKVVKSGG